MKSVFAGKSVLITGAGGSIGSQLCHLVIGDDAKQLVMLSLTEGGLYTIDRTLRQQYRKYRHTELVPVLGSVTDTGLLREILPGIDIVIHTAAHKHLPLCEQNPLTAIANNVGGTYVLTRAAITAGVKQFCLISSDKAVNPTSVMGMTKRAAELIVRDLTPATSKTRAFTVRFGNVLESAGSVIPLWKEQLAAGGPITITDKRCERYFMSITEAVNLIRDVIALEPIGGTFVLDMGQPRKLIDIALDLIKGITPPPALEFIGLRPGEKLREELHTGGDLQPTPAARVFTVEEHVSPLGGLQTFEIEDLLADVEARQTICALRTLSLITKCRIEGTGVPA